MSPVRAVILVVAAGLLSACTPVRSKLPPPYLLNDRQFSAEELGKYAAEQCSQALEGVEGTGPPPNAFTTDGCSAWPESRVQSCCLQHDVAYWCGVGNRREIDRIFRRCVLKHSGKVYANVAYAGVRLGGGRFMPFSWRFGYGRRWPFRKVPTNGFMFDVLAESETRPQNIPTSR
jgi:hypothetical protein